MVYSVDFEVQNTVFRFKGNKWNNELHLSSALIAFKLLEVDKILKTEIQLGYRKSMIALAKVR